MITLPSQTVFYSIERAIKEYRRFAQQNLNTRHKNITINQALVLFYLSERPKLSQKEIAALVFKDNASLTRMIELMAKNNHIKRSINIGDRRKFKLEITAQGKKILNDLTQIIDTNRKMALQNINKEELDHLQVILNKIIDNCKMEKLQPLGSRS